MAQKSRQNRLFAAEDFTVIYESYINANFQAFDYDTIRTAMVDYVRNNYPENYNDWVESAEFVSLLDVVAQFGHNLAYRVDVNARNNFLSTAEKQESVYKLAEFLGYQPRRNVPAYGEMKIVSVKTNEPVIGSAGISLGGTDLKYEVSNNVNNLDDFVTVVNAVLQNSNQFGSPKKSVVINNIKTEFYDFNNTPNQVKFDAQGSVSGASVTFNIISSDYDNYTRSFTEKYPDPVNSFGLYYKNDGKGISSVNTGFFFGLKQGSLQYEDIVISEPIDNASFDINATNVNNSDVWVQNINSTGNVLKNWTKVVDVNSNVIYNNLAQGERDVFSVKTRKDNAISVVFPDRTFGNVPTDTLRVWYRTSVNSTYILRPDDIATQKVQINYTGSDGNNYNAVFTLQLKQSISTASSNETLDQIRENAPRNYASQDRMITAQDYNTMLGNSNGGILKIKSVNRTFSGHSRYSKFTDPTGTYSNLYLQGNDATLYSENKLVAVSASISDTANGIYQKYVKDILDNDEFINLYYDGFRSATETLKTTDQTLDSNGNVAVFTWNNESNSASGVLSGYLTDPVTSNTTRVGTTATTYMKHLKPGALVKFAGGSVTAGSFVVGTEYEITVPGDTDFTLIGAPDSYAGTVFTAAGVGIGTGKVKPTKNIWAKVVDVNNNGLGVEGTGVNAGKPTGLQSNGTGAIVLDRKIPTNSTVDVIYPALSRKFSNREKDLFISYFEKKKPFSIKYNQQKTTWEIDTTPPPFSQNDTYPANFNVADIDNNWVVYFNYTGVSYDIYIRTRRFIFNSASTKLGNIQNEVEIGSFTKKAKRDTITLKQVNTDFSNPQFISAGSFYVYGYDSASSNEYRLSLIDSNADSRPDNPNVFYDIVGLSNTSETSSGNSENGKINNQFEWEHIAADNQVVDPSFTNVIDVFALSKSYDTEYKNYLKGATTTVPTPPTSYELGTQFTGVVDKKAVSDTVVYKPVKYRPLFGTHADPQLKARFRIIKLYGSNVTDTDLKTKTVDAIDSFFNSSNWDFGETFYFTELAAYVHKELAGLLSSFVIVPQGAGSVFGDMFEFTPNADELIIADVNVNDVDIITNITDANIKAGT